MSTRTETTATVHLTVAVTAEGSWDPRASMAEVHRQAIESALNRLARVLGDKSEIKVVSTSCVDVHTRTVPAR